jgi:hypothetical protein
MQEYNFDLLHGHQAIAEFTGLAERQVRHLIEIGALPTFKIARNRCARRSTLTEWLASLDRVALNPPQSPMIAATGEAGPASSASRR